MNPLSPLQAGDGNSAIITKELGDGGSNLTDTLRDIMVKLAEASSQKFVTVSPADLAADGTSVKGLSFPFPFKVTAVNASAQVATGGTSNEVDVLKAGVSILDALIDIKTGVPAPIEGVIDADLSLSTFAAGDILTVESVQVGAGAGEDVQVTLTIEKLSTDGKSLVIDEATV